MIDQELHTFFKSLNSVSRIATPKHAKRLRQALLINIQQQSASNKFGKYKLFSSYFFSFFMKHKNLVGAVSMTVAVFIGIIFFSLNTPAALAEKIINDSLVKIVDFTPNEIKNIYEKIGENPIDSLKEAKSAKDLKIITKEEFVSEFRSSTDTISMIQDPNHPGVIGYGVTESNQDNDMIYQEVPDSSISDDTITQATSEGLVTQISPSNHNDIPHDGDIENNITTYLSYTDSLGRRACLGLDTNNIPVFKQVIFK